MNQVKYIDLHIKEYKEAWDFQQDIQNRLIRAKTTGENPEALPYLIFVEHPHVYTLGKSGQENNLLINPGFLASINATFYHTDRGGDITYHGPGQLVGYPVFDLDRLGIGAKTYIFRIEESIIALLKEFKIDSGRLEGATGVWIKKDEPPLMRKICAIGVKISRGITMHGFALNVNTNLSYFSWINPCGYTDKGVTSIEEETGIKVDMEKVKALLSEKIASLFEIILKT
ncbi:MAG TPA: lipoyl(octanoyl) transferase LipB [Bacteroidales bacterium]|jgi:lipoyl(octanoyl) transferase|nr:lipoyl(octanoyl) transferase LipB [Bacteroidales bacterium]